MDVLFILVFDMARWFKDNLANKKLGLKKQQQQQRKNPTTAHSGVQCQEEFQEYQYHQREYVNVYQYAYVLPSITSISC